MQPGGSVGNYQQKLQNVFMRSVFMIALALACMAAPETARSQPNLNFKRVTVNWPTIELYFSVGCDGNPAYNMTKQDFRIFENGQEIKDFTLWCPDPTIRCAISVALVFDASGSMAGTSNTEAKQAGHAFVDLMDGVVDEAAVIWFNTNVTVYQQMTTAKPMLHSAIDALPAGGGSALWDGAYAAILELVNNGVNQCRAVILMTDGGDTGSSRTFEEVISLANRHRIRVFTLGFGPATIPAALEMVALLTGGRYYYSPNSAQLAVIYQEISTIIFQGFQECIITYERNCADAGMRTVELQLANFCGGTDIKTKTYRAPMDTTTFSNLYLEFGDAQGMGDSDVKVPLNLLTPINDEIIYPLTFTVLFDPSCLALKGASTPSGTLLYGTPLTVTPVQGGVEISVPYRKVVSGSGSMLELTFHTANPKDTVCCEVRTDTVAFEQGCRIPVIDPGEVCIYPPLLHPVITLSGSTDFCEGGSVVLSAPAGFSAYAWSTGDTTESITVTTSGDYSVTVTDSIGGKGTSPLVTVVVHPAPHPSIVPGGPITLCPGQSATLSANLQPDYVEYQWSTGDTTRMITVRDAGWYAVSVRDSGGCWGTSDSVRVEIQEPHIDLALTGTTDFCSGDSLIISIVGSYTAPRWSTGSTASSITVKQPGMYWVESVNPGGCTSRSDTIHVTIRTEPKPTVSVTGSPVLCPGDSVTLAAKEGYADYQWSTGSKSHSIVVRTPGLYSVVVLGPGGCHVSSDTIVINTVAPPMISPLGPTEFCHGDSVTLDAGPGYVRYDWSTGEQQTRQITVADSGSYTVTVVDSSGCTLTSQPLVVTVYPLPATPVITRAGDVLGTGTAHAYQWIRDGMEIAGETSQFLPITELGEYQVRVTTAEGCSAVSDIFPVKTTGIAPPATIHDFTVFPDPNDGVVTVRFTSEQPVRVHLILANLLGQTVLEMHESRPVTDYQRQVNLGTVKPGVYILRIDTGESLWTRKIVRK